MRLRQKLFAAIFAVMVIVFLMLALVSFMQGLETQRLERELEARLDATVARRFRETVSSDAEDRWDRFSEDMNDLHFAPSWRVRGPSGELLRSRCVCIVCVAARAANPGTVEVARHGGYVLLGSPRGADFRPVGWLSGLFWAVAAGTAFLLLIVYGLLLRLVLRPVEDLVSASRSLSKGVRPPKVTGESRTDEMGELVRAFNKMTDEVSQRREDLQRRVDEATREYRKAQERLVLEQRLAATGKLAAGIAHEINNPLGGMINAARSLSEKEDALSERGREYLGLVEDGLGRIAKIVERMRAFVRPHPSVGPVDLVEAVRSALAFVRHRIDEKGVTLREEFPQEPLTVTGDAGELQQVFLNLVLNALDAMRESETRELVIELEQAGGEAAVTISDTGAGMDPEQLATAFDLFYSTKDEGGTGLGLGIAHKIVTDHGGTIELESSPGEGTTAGVRLPLAERGEVDGGGRTQAE